MIGQQQVQHGGFVDNQQIAFQQVQGMMAQDGLAPEQARQVLMGLVKNLEDKKPELKEECIALGKKYGIVTPYTSYLVLEDVAQPVAQNRPPPPPRPGGTKSSLPSPRSGSPHARSARTPV